MSRKILIGFAYFIILFILVSSPTLAQQSDRPVVKLIYIPPSEGAPELDIDRKIIKAVEEAQSFFANEMERHGFGRKTFLIETDASGKPVVHHGDSSGQIDGSEDIRFTVDSNAAGGGLGDSTGFRSGYATIFYKEGVLTWRLAAHELGHAFGLPHDFRSGAYIMSYGPGRNQLSQCNAEWLDVHRAFTPDQPALDKNQPTTIKMLPPRIGSAPNAIRLRFEVTDRDGLYQAQLFTLSASSYSVIRGQSFPGGNVLQNCERLNGNPSSTIEFVTTVLTPHRNQIGLRVIDVHGNWNGDMSLAGGTIGQGFTIDVTSLLTPPKIVPIPDTRLLGAVRDSLHLSHDQPQALTSHVMLDLQRLNVPNYRLTDLTGIEHAINLTELNLGGDYISGKGWENSNAVSDFSPLERLTNLKTLSLSFSSVSSLSFLVGLAQLESLYLSNNILTDISPLMELPQLRYLDLNNNTITDVSALAELTELTTLYLHNNAISDISALAGMMQLRELYIGNNSISDVSALAGLAQLEHLYLSDNAVSDVSPLLGLHLIGTYWDSTGLNLERNPLSYASINTHIPAMLAKGIEVKFDPRTPTTLVKISGTAQQGTINTALPLPFVVEVRDQQNQAFAGVPVMFSMTIGNGRLSATTTTTDTNGRAAAHLTLGRSAGKTTIRVTAADISQPVQFTVTAMPLNAPVAITDTNLQAEIVETLDKQRGATLTASDMLKLTTLTADGANIRDLTGLQYAPNLKILSLDDNNISDVGPLSALTRLETLSLDDNNISDVTPFAGLTQLQTLSLENNSILNIAPLESLTQLKTLHLRGNLLSYPSLHTYIPAIQAGGSKVRVDLRTPTTLMKFSGTHGVPGTAHSLIVEVQDEKGFGFSGVPVTFTVTAGGGQLFVSNAITDSIGRVHTFLTLDSIPGKNTVRVTATGVSQPVSFTITTIEASSPITIRDADLRMKIVETLGKSRGAQLTAGDMLALTRLNAPNANIQNLSGLEHAHNLQDLNLGGEYINGEGWVNSNKVSDFSPLFGLAQLAGLNLNFSALSDASFLSRLTQVKTLQLGSNKLSDISVLSGLTQLTNLTLWNNEITELAPLSGLTQLTFLSLSSNAIEDVSDLAGLTQLTHLDLGNNPISNLTPLAALVQLTSLNLNITNISNISALAGLTQLTALHLAINNISDVLPLANLTQLTFLYLYNNAITEVEPLAGLMQLTVLYLSNNTIADMSPLVGLNLTGTQWDSTGLFLERNPLSYASINTHIPAMQAKGVAVKFDNRAHPALLKVSGDAQENAPGAALETPFVVETVDASGKPMQGVSVTFAITTGSGQLSVTTATTDATGKARTTLILGRSPGKHTVTATATEITLSTLTFTAIGVGESVRFATDVNGDGIVNIQDLVLVASNFGQTGQSSADVNGDGVVNIQDLVMVAGVFGEGAAAAPTLQLSDLKGLTTAEVQDLLTQARRMALTDPAYLRGIAVLEQLLALLLPTETALLPNYPNPFNPETWIPYQLAAPADVILHIYSVNGVLLRTLTLGHQPAGMYHNRNRAVYWDGRNEVGEPVASGVYFYTLTASDFTATRKMLIRK